MLFTLSQSETFCAKDRKRPLALAAAESPALDAFKPVVLPVNTPDNIPASETLSSEILDPKAIPLKELLVKEVEATPVVNDDLNFEQSMLLEDNEDLQRELNLEDKVQADAQLVLRSFFEELGPIIKEAHDKVNFRLDQKLGGQPVTLEECIALALRGNEDIETAIIGRENDLANLRTSEDEFKLGAGVTINGLKYQRSFSRTAPHTDSVTLPAPSLALNQKFKTGGSMAFSWTNEYGYTKPAGKSFAATAGASTSLSFSQPLLKGAGYDIATLSLTRAYLSENKNVLTLKNTIIGKITDVIKSYRSYYQAIENYEIQRRAIVRKRESFKKTEIRYAAKKEAEAALIERQQDLVEAEFGFEDRWNDLETARIALLRLLNLDTDLQLRPSGIRESEVKPEDLPTVEQALKIAYAKDPNYISQLIAYREAELTFLSAKNDLLWDLNFTAGVSSGNSGGNSLAAVNEKTFDFKDRALSAGLELKIPAFRDRSRENSLISARVGIRTAKISLRTKRQNLEENLKNKLREIEKNFFQLKLKKISTLLAKKRLEQKQVELDLGRISQFEFTDAEERYLEAETTEVGSKISYLNSLNELDQLLGTTLETWKISVSERTAKMPAFEDTLLANPVNKT